MSSPNEHLYTLKAGIATWRRILFLLLIIIPSVFCSGYMAYLLPHQGSTKLELLVLILFTTLFVWISMGFWTAMVGFFVLLRRVNRFSLPDLPPMDLAASASHPRTAILMPICNEDPYRVFAGMGAVFKSLDELGRREYFDFFILSDSNDPDTWVDEEWCWYKLCHLLNGFQKLFYRRRRINRKRKSGNIADFCRRWGHNYRYMIVLDADSVMTGATLVRMVEIMEQNYSVGILQTVPKGVGRDSLIARLQQFSNNIYGPMFAAGLHFWQLGDAHFWGHNAIIRIKPFMEHCDLPRLSGKPPLGGEILSHDFVEAALMRRAGWAVWLAYNLEGSYEEMPPTLLDDLKRDRRWCQGNLQHLRLLFIKGLCPAHRAMFLNGAMAYLTALFWLLFLVICTVEAIYHELVTPAYFTETISLFPDWPVWRPERSMALLFITIIILFLPKPLAFLLHVLRKGSARSMGGAFKLMLSILTEILLSALFAPVRMLFNSKFVMLTLMGKQVGWGAQSRQDTGTPWGVAVRYHWGSTVLGLVWGIVTFIINRTFFWWITPVLAGLILSMPLSVLTSRSSVGRAFRAKGLLVIPEELNPPPELEWIRSIEQKLRALDASLGVKAPNGFARAVAEPFVNELHIQLAGHRRAPSFKISKRRQALQEKALLKGPESLSPSEKFELLYDPERMASLHQAVWELPDRSLAAAWGLV
jgi:membrane glycosyltransferase